MDSDKTPKGGKSLGKGVLVGGDGGPSDLLEGKSLTIIKHRGQPNKAQTLNGDIVTRSDGFFVDFHEDGNEVFVPSVQYDNHFLYEAPETQLGPAHMCSCGSPAIFVMVDDSPLFLCYHDAITGFKGQHQTTVLNIKEWGKYASGDKKAKFGE